MKIDQNKPKIGLKYYKNYIIVWSKKQNFIGFLSLRKF